MLHPSWYIEQKGSIFILRLEVPGNRVGMHAAFSTRKNGTSRGPFEGLNLGYSAGDDSEKVSKNREIFLRTLGFGPKDTISTQQVHGDHVYVVHEEDRGKGGLGDETLIPRTDALITGTPGLPLMMFFADCVPIFLFDPEVPAIAIVHSGREGTLKGVALQALGRMKKEFGSLPERCFAAIGPSIRGCCYAVDDRIMTKVKSLTNDGYTMTGLPERPGMYALDLAEVNRILLANAGICPDQIQKAPLCTSCNPSLFYSHQRDVRRVTPGSMAKCENAIEKLPADGATGRMVGVAWLGDSDGSSR
jgi:YfiH family protein